MTASIAGTANTTASPGAASRQTRRIAQRGILSLADQAASSAATFVTGAIIGRTCPREQFGMFALSLSVLAWATNMQSAFVTTPYIYSSAALDHEGRRAYAGSTFLGQSVYAIVATCIVLVAAFVTSLQPSRAQFASILLALAVVLWCLLVKEYCRQMAFAHLSVVSAFWLDVSVGVLQIGGLLGLASWGEMSVTRAYWIIGAASAVPSLVWLVVHRHDFAYQRTALRPAARRNWEFGRWLPGGYIMNAASRDSYPWLVTALRGTAAAGTLAASTGIAFLVTPIISGISNVLAPTFAKHYASGGVPSLRAMVRKATLLGAAGIACYCLVMMVVGGHVAAFVYGPSYAGEGHLVALLALSVAATVISTPVGMAMYVMRRADINFRAAGMAVIVVGVLGIAFIYFWGVLGAAVALVCGTLAESAYKWWRYEDALAVATQSQR
jgi:O-antigen/teichoic acid export membrane protein